MDLGNIIVTPAGTDNPYRFGISGAERSAALGRFLRGIDAPGFDFWCAPTNGGARKIESGSGLVRAEVVDFYWNADGTIRRCAMNSWHFDGHGINDSEGRRLLKATVPQYGPEGGEIAPEFMRVSVMAAAAPDLLAALETLAASLLWEEKRSGTTYHGIDAARAAIAKAKGE